MSVYMLQSDCEISRFVKCLEISVNNIREMTMGAGT